MAQEKFIAPKHDSSKHPSMKCHRTRFEASKAAEDNWRTEFDLEMIRPYVVFLEQKVGKK